jgi:hypothetical protein
MHRLAWAPLLALAACGETTDDRPLELEYLTQAIFAPTCGATQCHSSFTQASGVVFDTPEAARRTLIGGQLIQFGSENYDPDKPEDAALIHWITDIDPFGLGVGRMPFDSPMPNKDVLLLQEWISKQAPGAQCDPEENNGNACNNKEVVKCNMDWTFGARVQLCAGECGAGMCL